MKSKTRDKGRIIIMLLAVIGLMVAGCDFHKEKTSVESAESASLTFSSCHVVRMPHNDSYKTYSVEGSISSVGQYFVPIDTVLEVSNKTGAPIICDKTNSEKSERDRIAFAYGAPIQRGNDYTDERFWQTQPCEAGDDLITNWTNSPAQFPPDNKYDRFNIMCCSGEYCAILPGKVHEVVHCKCGVQS